VNGHVILRERWVHDPARPLVEQRFLCQRQPDSDNDATLELACRRFINARTVELTVKSSTDSKSRKWNVVASEFNLKRL
jgi:hypothetical protein